jgi:CTP-dependent riboflavin kinase
MVTIRGKVFVGLGEGGKFVALEWVEKQIKEKLGFKPYPGTLNLKIEEKESLDVIRELRKAKGISIEPPDPKSCSGKCF